MPDTIELLAPAGNFEKLEIALHYGADAVYLAGKDFSLRNFSGNFTFPEIGAAVRLVHDLGKRVYVACNIYPRNHELAPIAAYLAQLGEVCPDAVIVADPGVFQLARDIIPDIPLHISTQANTTHWADALFWKKMGAVRINAARELRLSEISEIVQKSQMEVECFVHGAMCISYSGRCLLSSFLAGRDSNRGQCCHPCRWQYAVMEETRPGTYMPVMEDPRGTYIFNSRDLCMIAHLPEMIQAGIASLKIEGRMKGIHYIAAVVKTYREALDAWRRDPAQYRVEDSWLAELGRISHRGYSTGFYLGSPDQILPNFDNYKSFQDHVFLGKVLEASGNRYVTCDVRNKIRKGESVEMLVPKGPPQPDSILDMTDMDGASLEEARTGTTVKLLLKGAYAPCDLIRKARE